MLDSVAVVFAIAGIVALFLGILGGGIKVKEVEIPHSPPKSRVIVGTVGVIFIGISLWLSLAAPTINAPQPSGTATFSITQTSFPSTPTLVTSTETPLPSPTLTAAPTLTVEEQAAEILKTASQSWKLVVLDTFDNNDYNWTLGEKYTSDQKDLANISINGKYHVDIKTIDGGGWWLGSDIQTPAKFYLASDIRRTTTQPGCIMSLYWGTSNGDYLFEVYDDEKNYKLEVYDREITENKGWRDVIPKTTSSLLLPRETNRAVVINDGTYIWLYINDQFLNRAMAEYTSKGDLGYYVSVCNEDSQVTFEFDNLELRSP